MVFMGCGFTSGGQESGSVFSAAVCKIQASKRYIESLPLVPKEKAVFLKLKDLLYSCLLTVCPPEVGCLIDIWKPSNTCTLHGISKCI